PPRPSTRRESRSWRSAQRGQHNRQRLRIRSGRNAHKRARGLYLNHPLRRRRAILRFYRRGDAPLRTALIRNRDRNECRRIRRRLFARQSPGLLAPTMQQAAAHAMSTGDCGDVRTRRETLRHYSSALLVAPTPATARSANQLDTAVALVTLATVLMSVLMIVILHGEPRRDLGLPRMLSDAPQIGRWRRRAANFRFARVRGIQLSCH